MIDFRLQKMLNTGEGSLTLDVAASIERGKFVCLYGSSGAGKTSILKMLAGFLKPDNGYVNVNDAVWIDTSRKLNTPAQQRTAGFVFQDYALFPNMNVRKNIAFGLSKKDSNEIVDELLEVTGLTGLASRSVQTLSGGQQQRVALARAIAKKPPVLLLDEPLSAIDRERREQLQETLAELHIRFKLTTILVSHDAEEIMKLADLVLHLRDGKFTEESPPAEFFSKDVNENRLLGTVVSRNESGATFVKLRSRIVKINIDDSSVPVNTEVEIINEGDRIILRPHNVL